MTKSDLVDAVASATGLSKSAAGGAVDAVFETIESALKSGEKVTVTGFGTFEKRRQAARTARDIRSGATIQVPARNKPHFTAGKGLKEAVN